MYEADVLEAPVQVARSYSIAWEALHMTFVCNDLFHADRCGSTISMELSTRKSWLWSTLLVVTFSGSRTVAQQPDISAPASFVFGDSLVDAGNNNYIPSLARANYASNGIDFPGGKATGRFCNGRHVPDIVGQELGLPFAPVFMDPTTKGAAVLKGVNYASGGAGILDDTGATFLQVIPMDKQVSNFEVTKNQIIDLIGPAAADELITNSLFSVTMGSNDYLNNYFLPGSLRARDFTPQQYQDIVINKYRGQLQKLYDLGARRIVIASVGPLGCIPYQLTVRLRQNGQCDPENSLIVNFNAGLKSLIEELNTKVGKPHYILVNAYDIVIDLTSNPGAYGFETSTKACCGIGGQYNGLLPCVPTVQICRDRTKNVFWDPFHPTDAANIILARQFLDGDDAYPMNIRQLLNYRF